LMTTVNSNHSQNPWLTFGRSGQGCTCPVGGACFDQGNPLLQQTYAAAGLEPVGPSGRGPRFPYNYPSSYLNTLINLSSYRIFYRDHSQGERHKHTLAFVLKDLVNSLRCKLSHSLFCLLRFRSFWNLLLTLKFAVLDTVCCTLFLYLLPGLVFKLDVTF